MVGSLKYRFRRPIAHLKKIKHVKWLLPGWAFYEFYKIHKKKGDTTRKSFGHGVKAEAIRLAATASLPVPGTYELTTTGLAAIKRKIENGELDDFTLKAFKDFTPLKKMNLEKQRKFTRKIYFKIFYRKGQPYFKVLRKK